MANERLEGGRVNFFSFVDVDRAAHVSVETRVEETGRILQRRALGEGKLHGILVGFASADDAVMRPNWSAEYTISQVRSRMLGQAQAGRAAGCRPGGLPHLTPEMED